jgi:type III pantothenate kinase
MLLAINIGNTNTTLGLADGAGWRARWRLATRDRRTVDELRAMLAGLFQLDGLDVRTVTDVAIASVVPTMAPKYVQLTTALFDCTAWVVGPGARTGLDIRYQPAAALGTDRVLDAVAARALVGAPVVAVDFGTATTFNVVGQDGAFLGGAIAPGVAVAAEALVAAGARLRSVDLVSTPPGALVGRTTEASLRSGALYGYAGLVDGLLARIAQELAARGEPEAPVIATGGLAGVVAPLVNRIIRVEPSLTLDGLRLLHDMQRAAA